MATTRRQQSPAVIERLSNEPWRFDFLQAVRLLEAAVHNTPPSSATFAKQALASLSPPEKELVHFHNEPSLAFSAANISALSQRSVGDEVELASSKNPIEPDNQLGTQQWHLALRFMGLVGSQGVMPHYFSEILLQRLRDNDRGLAAFINIFEHRSISLFHRASSQYQVPLQYEQGQRQGANNTVDSDLFTTVLAALAGLASPHMEEQLPLPLSALLGYSGLYARPIRSAVALQSMLQDYFSLDAEIEQFCGQWQDLPDDFITRLAGGDAGSGCNNNLGQNALLGTRCWQVQSKFRIHLAVMDYPSFMQLAPGGKKLKALQSFIDFFASTELDYEICVKLEWQDARPTQLSTHVNSEPLLGWNTPLGQSPYGIAADDKPEPIQIFVSKNTTPADAGLPMAI